jgi:hypothetical protein
MPDPPMTDRTEDNILWPRLTAVTAKGVYTITYYEFHLFNSKSYYEF